MNARAAKAKRAAIKTKPNEVVVPVDHLKTTPRSASILKYQNKTAEEGYQFTPAVVMEINDSTKYFNMH